MPVWRQCRSFYDKGSGMDMGIRHTDRHYKGFGGSDPKA